MTIFEHNKKHQEGNKNPIPEDVCPVCWGYQEYDQKFRKIFKDDQIDVIHHSMKFTKIRTFVRKYVDGIWLRESETQTCPKCGNDFIEDKKA